MEIWKLPRKSTVDGIVGVKNVICYINFILLMLDSCLHNPEAVWGKSGTQLKIVFIVFLVK